MSEGMKGRPSCTNCNKPLRRTPRHKVEPALLCFKDRNGHHWGWRGTVCCSVYCAGEQWAMRLGTMNWDDEILNPA